DHPATFGPLGLGLSLGGGCGLFGVLVLALAAGAGLHGTPVVEPAAQASGLGVQADPHLDDDLDLRAGLVPALVLGLPVLVVLVLGAVLALLLILGLRPLLLQHHGGTGQVGPLGFGDLLTVAGAHEVAQVVPPQAVRTLLGVQGGDALTAQPLGLG